MASGMHTTNPSKEGTKENVANKAQEMASNVADTARQAAANVADKAKQAASTVGQRAEDATHGLGSGMKSLGETLRDKAPQGGVLGGAASTVAGGLERGGQYLQEEGISGMASDLTDMIRRNPIPALLVGVGIGFILARATSRS